MEINIPLDKAIGGTTAAIITGLLLATYGSAAAKKTIEITKSFASTVFKIPAKLWYRKKSILTAAGITILPHAILIACDGVSIYTEIGISHITSPDSNIKLTTVTWSIATGIGIVLFMIFVALYEKLPRESGHGPKHEDLINNLIKDLEENETVRKNPRSS